MADLEILKKITGRAPRVGMGVVVLNAKNQVLMCRRDAGPDSYKGKLHFFGGKLELGEDMRSGIIRELEEETGIKALESPHAIQRVGLIEEIESDCICVDESTHEKYIYHWVSSVWLLIVDNDFFENREPEKHYDVGWYDLNSLMDLDLAPSAHKTIIETGLLATF